MECAEVRDCFSSLVEGELLPAEEKEVRDHLSSCPECQSDFRKFEKTIHWLHSVEEVEVPERFLSEVREKLQERKQGEAPAKKTRWGPFSYPPRVKLPIQAVAMVAVLFLVLYVTKMMPVQMSPEKAIQSPQTSPSEEKKAEPIQPPSDMADVKGGQQPKAPVVQEGRADKITPLKQQEKDEEKDFGKREVLLRPKAKDENVLGLRQSKEATAPAPKVEVSQPSDLLKPVEKPLAEKKREEIRGKEDLKEPEAQVPGKKVEEALLARREFKEEGKAGAVSTEAPRPENVPEGRQRFSAPPEREKGWGAKGSTAPSPSPPIKEILLNISDRDKFLTRLYDLVGEVGGDVVQTEENVLLASVPARLFPGFEKELDHLSRIQEPLSPKQTPLGKLSSIHVPKRKEVKDKDKEVKAKDSDREDRVSIRIRLIKE